MKLQVRQNVFETNSSSVHSITMCMEKDLKAWKKGLKYYDTWDEKLVDAKDHSNDDRYIGYDQYWERYEEYCEGFEEKFTTPSGEKVIAFGYYGNDY